MLLSWMKIVLVGKKYSVFKHTDRFLIIDSTTSTETTLTWIFVFAFKACFDESSMR